MEHQTVKKIMFHINSLGKGGAERVVVNLSGEFIKNGREVIIATESQVLTLKHEARDRALFAEGAIAAAEFLFGKEPGLYQMEDLLRA